MTVLQSAKYSAQNKLNTLFKHCDKMIIIIYKYQS